MPANSGKLSGRTFLLTGANTGIGLAERSPSVVATPELARALWEHSDSWTAA